MIIIGSIIRAYRWTRDDMMDMMLGIHEIQTAIDEITESGIVNSDIRLYISNISIQLGVPVKLPDFIPGKEESIVLLQCFKDQLVNALNAM